MKPGYKQTEVGVIPEDWSEEIISDFSTVIRGASPRPKGDRRFYGGPVPRLMVEDVTRDGKYVTPSVDSLTVEGAKYSRPCIKGTLTIVCSGTVGVASFLAVDACIHDGFLALTNISKRICSDYLYHQLCALRERFDVGATHGGVFTNLTTTGVKSFVFPIPPTLPEQEAIAEILTDADEWIAALERLIEKKRSVKQGAMQELLSGKRRLPGFDGEWERKRLGEMLSVRHGRSQHQVADPYGCYPILGTGGELGRANRFLYDKPSVLIGRKGTIDAPQFMDTPFWSVDTLFYSEVHDPNNAKYLFYRFCLIDWVRHNEASGVPSLNARTIESIEIESPPPAEQTAIAAVLSDMDEEIGLLEGKLAKARLIKRGMMQALLTGRVRLQV
jgi:type I restriction enzyme S subunit